ncbi:MAG: hypothetical protein KDA99_15965 [Planctomycetales bacterium]|nr:hypothetical protein [Planctomycetales bacterium]
MTNPVFFEDPRTLTEARIIYLRHKVPLAATGGDVNLLAVQLRAALTDRLSIIATKDGYAWSTNPLIDDGWADVAAGLKYTLLRDPCRQRLLSVGLTYEMPVGTPGTQQGNKAMVTGYSIYSSLVVPRYSTTATTGSVRVVSCCRPTDRRKVRFGSGPITSITAFAARTCTP